MIWIALAGWISGIVLIGYAAVLIQRGDDAAADRKIIIALLIFHSVGSMAK